MENCWNLKILFEDEQAWRQAVEELPGRAADLMDRVRELDKLWLDEAGTAGRREDAAGAAELRMPGRQREADGHRQETAGAPGLQRAAAGLTEAAARLEEILRGLEEMVRISFRAEIWLSRMVAQYPVDPYYAGLSDELDRLELGELPLKRELQRVLRQIPDLKQIMGETAYLNALYPWTVHLCGRIIPLETLDSETGGGWYRLRSLLDPVSLEFRGEKVSFRELLEMNDCAEWGEEMPPCLYELCCRFYEECGDRAADILLDVLGRDEADYRREGSDSLTVYLRDTGFSQETVQAMILAVEEALPGWYRCKRHLDAWHAGLCREAETGEREPDEADLTGEDDRSAAAAAKMTGEELRSETDAPKADGEELRSATDAPKADGEELRSETDAPKADGEELRSETDAPKADGEERRSETDAPNMNGEDGRSAEDSLQEDPCTRETDTEEEIDARNRAAYLTLRDTLLEQFADFHPEYAAAVQEAFDGNWVWINDDPLACRDQHASMIPETGLSYIALAADCYLPAAAHELGHAWHNRCLKGQNVLYHQNEMLMELPGNLAALWSYRWTIDHRFDTLAQLEAAGAPPETVEYYRALADSPALYEDLLSETIANVYDGYASFCFERELRSRITEETLTRDDITQMYLVYRRRLLLPEDQAWHLDPFRWIERGSLFSCRSYYNLPYMVSMLLAYRILADLGDTPAEERPGFWQGLTRLLRRMNREPAEQVLADFFGEDVTRVEFWRTCTRGLEDLFDEICAAGV